LPLIVNNADYGGIRMNADGRATLNEAGHERGVGKDASCGNVTRREFIAAASVTLLSTAVLGQQSPQSPLAMDRHRPRFHLMPPSAWLNDPNGPLYWEGRYHLFYQYSPTISNFGTKYWGHAASSDLVHWKNLGIALAPTPGGPDKNGCWSGSAVVANGVPTIVYTGGTWSAESEGAERERGIIPERQMVAVAADPTDPYLRKWIKVPENPVLAAPPAGIKAVGWRDPSLWKEGDTWYMVIGSGEVGKGGMALLYSSRDLRKFTYLHPLAVAKPDPGAQDPTRPWASMWECPDFFFLQGKPILLVARGNGYLTGTYSDHRFQQESGGQIDYGSAAYAQKTMEDEKGRRIWWAWIHEKRSPQAQVAAGWAGVMSLPRLLTLQSDGSLGVEPVSELKVLRRRHKTISNQKIDPNGPSLLKQFASNCAEIEAEIELGDSRQAGLRVRSTADGSEQTLIGYDRDSQKVFCDTTSSSTDPETLNLPPPLSGRGIQGGALNIGKMGLLRLRIYIDASVIETFADGKVSLSDRVYPTSAASLGIGLFAKGGTARLRNLTLWDLAPISNDRLTSGAELFRV
jgi:beta-fructofuranosidase